ncbi:NAD-dependent epimerase/dehydratase family protein [Natrinema salsiterrestre]|uniref:NAD-dependent epimerase/dehydratase family protein n=1 Tax=Natrinema salsiterrestre TaxID=2950540 RepID=A0A9Q4KY20_9EURY|nr:NAD-dependent epimerase/dehydratase family protein [Natrinema salsiterrestre]MDF9745870.1 NAD-dependent epimerase/dehydratase family protein [Natrinema salsiterrestre]
MNSQDDFRPISGNRILVTGGAGFIGSTIVEALVPENDVRILDNLSSGSRSNVPDKATLIEGDIRDETALERATNGVDVIFHQAALISVEGSVRRPKLTHDVNVTATVKLLERAREESARFVFASSAAVYGHPKSVPISEEAPTEPTSPYGLSKLAAERYVRLYADLYDVSTISLRYFNVYGPGQMSGDYSAVISVFAEQALNGKPITVEGDGSQTRDFVHVRDVMEANLLAASADVTGVFNVGTGNSVSILELAETVRNVAASDLEIVHVEDRPGDIDQSQADVSRLKSELGFEPSISLADGLETVVGDTESEALEPSGVDSSRS